MFTFSIFYWSSVVASLYAAYLICFCLCKVDERGNKTDERIAVPRILYLLTFAVSFLPLLNLLFGTIVIVISVIAYYVSEGFYFKTWLLDKPNQKEKQKEKE